MLVENEKHEDTSFNCTHSDSSIVSYLEGFCKI